MALYGPIYRTLRSIFKVLQADIDDVDFPSRRKRFVTLVQICSIDEASFIVLKRPSPTVDMAENVNSWLFPFDSVEQLRASQMRFAWNRLIENSQWRAVCNQHVEVVRNEFPVSCS